VPDFTAGGSAPGIMSPEVDGGAGGVVLIGVGKYMPEVVEGLAAYEWFTSKNRVKVNIIFIFSINGTSQFLYCPFNFNFALF
jgi:hypothetical protein